MRRAKGNQPLSGIKSIATKIIALNGSYRSMAIIKCHCGSLSNYSQCCEGYIKGVKKAPTAEKLMRSRYSAYVRQEASYLVATTHSSEREF
jgi:SEC-C motif-containing protein